MATIFIGHLHQGETNDRDLFDVCYPAQTEIEIIERVVLETAKRITDDLDQLRALLNCTTKDALSEWFDDHMTFYSFSISAYQI